MGMAMSNSIKPVLWKGCVLKNNKRTTPRAVKLFNKYPKTCIWRRPCHLWCLKAYPLIAGGGSKATACLVSHFCYLNRMAIKLLKTSKQKCQQLHQRFTKGEISRRELKDHNNCTCLQGKRNDQNPLLYVASSLWDDEDEELRAPFLS